jgi:hypothetical protein
MKLNIEVEIDWIDEEERLDEVVKQNIIDGIVAKLSDGYISQITKEAESRLKEVKSLLSGQVNSKLDEMIENLFNDFMDKGVTITDQWGEPKGKPAKVIDILKSKLDMALGEKVSESGSPSTYGKLTRLEYMIDSRIKKAVEVMTKSVVGEVDKKIAELLNDEIKKRLSGSLLEKINVDAIVNNAIREIK